MRKLRLSDRAREFILFETKYLKKYNQSAAARFRGEINKAFHNLLSYPQLGRSDDAYPVEGVRRFVITDYVVHYSVADDAVEILYIRHVRQNEPWIKIEDDQDFEL